MQRNGLAADSYSEEDDIRIIASLLYDKQGYNSALSRVSDYIRQSESRIQRREWQRIAQEISNLCAADPECEMKT